MCVLLGVCEHVLVHYVWAKTTLNHLTGHISDTKWMKFPLWTSSFTACCWLMTLKRHEGEATARDSHSLLCHWIIGTNRRTTERWNQRWIYEPCCFSCWTSRILAKIFSPLKSRAVFPSVHNQWTLWDWDNNNNKLLCCCHIGCSCCLIGQALQIYYCYFFHLVTHF